MEESAEHLGRDTIPGDVRIPVIVDGHGADALLARMSESDGADEEPADAAELTEPQIDAVLGKARSGPFVQNEFIETESGLVRVVKPDEDLRQVLAVLESMGGSAQVNILDVARELEAQAGKFAAWLGNAPDGTQEAFYEINAGANREQALSFWFSLLPTREREALEGAHPEQIAFLADMQHPEAQAVFLARFDIYGVSH
jgi:hypothetical protein